MPESGTYGSVRGAVGNNRPYRERRPPCVWNVRDGRRPKTFTSFIAKSRNAGRHTNHSWFPGRASEATLMLFFLQSSHTALLSLYPPSSVPTVQ